jgi:V/A-type H+-transporting ATPase subunit E
MSIEKITSKIERDAQALAEETITHAKKEAWDIVKAANEKAERIIADAEKEGAETRDKQVVSRKAVAVIDGKNVTLAKKQKLIEECFEAAADKVASAPAKEYMDFLVCLVKAQGLAGGEIILARKDASLGSDLLARLKKEVPGSSFTISEETRNLRGGLLVRDGSTYYNASIEALIEDMRDDMTAEVAAMLFGRQE